MTPGRAELQALPAQVAAALEEDIGGGDLTAALVPEDAIARAQLVVRDDDAVLCGRAWFEAVFARLDRSIRLNWQAVDGDHLHADQRVCQLEGNARAILTGERTALNFLQTLSGTASLAARYVRIIAGTGAKILDTRKTLPGLRLAQKYAVRCGGASNHRIGLYDAILIKENHIRSAGSIAAAMRAATAAAGTVLIEIEVETLDEFKAALTAGAKRVLLDNFTLAELREAVVINQGRAELEASGGVSLDTLRAIAETGIDYISVGALTKDVKATDYSMLFEIA